MKILIIGSGGREHALLKVCLKSPLVKKVFIAPGNPGMLDDDQVECVNIMATQVKELLHLAIDKKIDLCLVGPEVSLEKGIVDLFEKNNILIFGPKREAAALEFSKSFAKEIMKKAGIKTADYHECMNLDQALEVINQSDETKLVIKDNGLASGKGVFVCENKDQAREAANFIYTSNKKTEEKRVLVEQFLQGRELSAFAICDGSKAISLGFACDYKRRDNFDEGPNTGGMGAYSPVDWAEESLLAKIQSDVFDKMMKTLCLRGIEYRGILYAGLMIKKGESSDWDISIIEFNTRFGDPEAQAILPLIDEDLIPWFLESAQGQFKRGSLKKKKESAVHLVLAAQGYPSINNNEMRKGDPIIYGDFNEEDELLYFSGVAKNKGQLITNGGRIAGITCLDKNRMLARVKAYKKLKDLKFENYQIRDDIGL